MKGGSSFPQPLLMLRLRRLTNLGMKSSALDPPRLRFFMAKVIQEILDSILHWGFKTVEVNPNGLTYHWNGPEVFFKALLHLSPSTVSWPLWISQIRTAASWIVVTSLRRFFFLPVVRLSPCDQCQGEVNDISSVQKRKPAPGGKHESEYAVNFIYVTPFKHKWNSKCFTK